MYHNKHIIYINYMYFLWITIYNIYNNLHITSKNRVYPAQSKLEFSLSILMQRLYKTQSLPVKRVCTLNNPLHPSRWPTSCRASCSTIYVSKGNIMMLPLTVSALATSFCCPAACKANWCTHCKRVQWALVEETEVNLNWKVSNEF